MSSVLSPFNTMSDDVLELEIRGLSARMAAAMCRFLLAVAEYDRRGSWQRWECHDMAGWLSWKCGISPVTARQYCRVGEALTRLGLVRERFAAGQLSYSQARAICRVATPATEAMLVEWAQGSTAAQLEQIARGYRRGSRIGAKDEKRRHEDRYVHLSYDDDGRVVGTLCLPAEDGALLKAALEAYVEQAAVAGAGEDGARQPFAAAQADALVELVTGGFEAMRSGELSDRDDRYLVTVITEERVLDGEGTVSRARAAGGGGSPGEDGSGEDGSGQDGSGQDGSGQDGEAGMCQIEKGPGLSAETLRRITCDAAVVKITEAEDGSVLDVGRRTRRISRRMRRALRHRDGGCQYPGCNRRGTEAHHIQHWAAGGPTNLSNLTTLCKWHHHRVHEGGYGMRLLGGSRFEFVHPSGWTIPDVYPAPDPEMSRTSWADPAPYEDGWDGTRLDVHMTTACLLHADEVAEGEAAGEGGDCGRRGDGWAGGECAGEADSAESAVTAERAGSSPAGSPAA